MDDNELETQRLHDQRQRPRDYEQMVKQQVRNETIDELCDWLTSCIESVDHNTETYKACTAMVNAMRGKKTSDTATLGTSVASDGSVVTHYPVTRHS
jgi:hypothetical protein